MSETDFPKILVVDEDESCRRTIAEVLGQRGYVVALASDGEEALDVLDGHEAHDGSEPAMVVLVDFTRSELDGLLFCRQVWKRHPERRLGLVLMNGADRIKDEFLHHAGAIDAISKPFDPEALATVVENALHRVRLDVPSATVLPEIDDDDGPTSKDLLTVPEMEAAEPQVTDHLALSGDLAFLPIGAVLQLLQMESQTGALIVETEDRCIIVTLRDGHIDFAQSRGVGDEFRLGRYVLEAGLVTQDELEELQAHRFRTDPDGPGAAETSEEEAPDSQRQTRSPAAPSLLGAWLVEHGKITANELSEALSRQTSELVYEVLRWQKGAFEFRKRPPSPEADASRLALHASQVVLEGFRRVDEWRVIEGRIGNFDQVLVRDDMAIAELDESRFDKSELAVLGAVDGQRTIRAIIAASHRSSFEACRILFQLLEARLLRRRAGP